MSLVQSEHRLHGDLADMLNAVILAGGRGRRMGHLTDDRQKCMIEVCGKPILAHVLDTIHATSVSQDVILATGYRADDVRDYFGSEYRGLSIEYVHDDRHLEDRLRLLLAEHLLTDPFVFLTGDVVCGPTLISEVVRLQSASTGEILGTLSGAEDHTPATSHGVVRIEKHKVISLEHPFQGELTPNHYREIGVSCLSKKLLPHLRRATQDRVHISHVVANLISQGGKFVGVPYRGRWLHFAQPADLKSAVEPKFLGHADTTPPG